MPGSSGSFPLHKSAIFDLLAKRDRVPVYMGGQHHLACHCPVLRRKATDAKDMHKLLMKCEHPNILKPSGAWEFGDMVFFTFPQIEGTLDQIDESELFIIDSTGQKDGFTKEGYKVFR
jgi:hypothetical protein